MGIFNCHFSSKTVYCLLLYVRGTVHVIIKKRKTIIKIFLCLCDRLQLMSFLQTIYLSTKDCTNNDQGLSSPFNLRAVMAGALLFGSAINSPDTTHVFSL